MPGGRSRSESVSGNASPPRAITIPFSSSPSWKPSTIASPAGDSASAACRCASSVVLRVDVEDAALAARVGGLQHGRHADRSRARRARSRGRAPRRSAAAGTPASASVRRIAILCVIRCAVVRADPGQPERLGDRRDDGTARSAETVSAPSTACRRATSVTAVDVGEVDRPRRRRRPASPSASGLRSTATTRRPSSRARRIARRWWRPAPTKRTVSTAGWYSPAASTSKARARAQSRAAVAWPSQATGTTPEGAASRPGCSTAFPVGAAKTAPPRQITA